MDTKKRFTTLRRMFAAFAAGILMIAALAPASGAASGETEPELEALRSGLLELQAALDSDALRWFALFDQDLVPLADAVEELESDVDALLVTIEAPMGPEHYQQALVQLSDGMESWHVVVNELSPYWQRVVSGWERDWAETVDEIEAEWTNAVSEWEQAWQDVTHDIEAEWTTAVDEWEQSWDQAETDIETEWDAAVDEWDQAWQNAATEWEQAWDQAATDWQNEWDAAVDEWEQAWEDFLNG